MAEIKIPVILRTGGHYDFDNKVTLALEVEKNNLYPLRIKSGIEYNLIERLILRMGFSGKPYNYTGGLGLRFSKFTTDIGFVYHDNLGITPCFSFQFYLQ